MRLLFAGTPEAGVPSLRRLLDSAHEVCAVLTRPDAPAGRGKRLSRSPVGELATEAGIPLLQPRGLRDGAIAEDLRVLAPDCCPVVAYGALIPNDVLAIPLHGWVNLHFSLLPAWRGAAPVQHAVWHGDDVTGATTFQIEEGLDSGPVFGTMVEPIGPRDTAGDLLKRLAVSGAELLLATLDGIEAGTVVAAPQPREGVSRAAKITVDDARVDWSRPAMAIDRQVRACTPVPGAWTVFRGQRVKVLPVLPLPDEPSVPPGMVRPRDRDWMVGTGTHPVLLSHVQPAGKRRMPAADWFRGLRPTGDECLQ